MNPIQETNRGKNVIRMMDGTEGSADLEQLARVQDDIDRNEYKTQNGAYNLMNHIN